MTASGDLRVLFHAAAGPRRGYGHLVRCLSLARAMRVRPLLSVRGSRTAAHTALALGADVVATSRPAILRTMRPDIVVIDDPRVPCARRWVVAARALGALSVTIHDLGLGWPDGDVIVDGSITRPARAVRKRTRLRLTGPRFAILNTAAGESPRPTRDPRGVLISLGGGARTTTALAIARLVARADRQATVRVVGGFTTRGSRATVVTPGVTLVPPSRDLRAELARATVAIVAGGVTLYEACAAGTPVVGLPVVAAQTPTVRAFGRAGAALAMPFRTGWRRAAADAVTLLDTPAWRDALSRRARRTVDGGGAARVARAILARAERHAR